MGTKVVVHSNAKRFAQVVAVALLSAAALIGLKRFSAWWRTPEIATSAAQGSVVYAPPGNILTGSGSVIDADTLEIHGVHIRLEGIDAPESTQHCGAARQEWACGQQAALALRKWLGDRTVSCNPKGQDRYQRTLARCFVDTEDVQAWLVLNGWALAYRPYSVDYVSAEEVAQARKAGLWSGEFVKPWEWRKSNGPRNKKAL